MRNKTSYFKSIDEASLRGNPGVPGEGGTKGSYIDDTEKAAIERIRTIERRYGPEMQGLMQNVGIVQRIQKGHESALEKLAEKTIRSMYGAILNDVELNIKFANQTELKKSMEDSPDDTPLEQLKDKKIIAEINKRKLLNNITQGEAKNSKRAMNMPEVISGLKQILGEEDAKTYVASLNKITDIADACDWRFPVALQKEMWKKRDFFGGSVTVEWKEENNEELADKILKDLAKSKDGELDEDDTEEFMSSIVPTINALGTDFIMLIHETVKGIYELIAANAIPDDQDTAEIVIMNTDSLADEIEDLKYGPKIAADLRDMINSFPESDEIENLREYVAGKLTLLPAEEFLDFMYQLLTGNDKAKKIIKRLIKDVIDELKEYDSDAALDKDDDHYSHHEEEKQEDLSKLSQKEIQAKVDKALDDEDYEKAQEYGKYLKESFFFRRTF